MNENQQKYHSSLEINDLIDDAVKNAVARRSDLGDLEDTLSDVEAADIAGGMVSPAIVLGRFCPITTVGIVYNPIPKDAIL